MPHVPVQSYDDFPNRRVVLGFLGRCVPDGQWMSAIYQDASDLHDAEAACRSMDIHPLAQYFDAVSMDEPRAGRLCMSLSDWNVLAKAVQLMLAGHLRLLFQAVQESTRIVPLPWHALSLSDSAFAEWGKAAGMVALPLQSASAYLECQYPAQSARRQPLEHISGPGHAQSYKTRHVLGFLVTVADGTHYLACHGDDWRDEVASSAQQLDLILTIMMRVGLQMISTGNTEPLPDMCWALERAGTMPALRKLHTLLQAYRTHMQTTSLGPDPHADKTGANLLRQCMLAYICWQDDDVGPARDLQHAPWTTHQVAPGKEAKAPEGNGAYVRGPSFLEREMNDAPGPRSAFGAVDMALNPSDPSGLKRKRSMDGVSGEIKRVRVNAGLDAHALGSGQPSAGTHAARVVVPVRVIFMADAATDPPSAQGGNVPAASHLFTATTTTITTLSLTDRTLQLRPISQHWQEAERFARNGHAVSHSSPPAFRYFRALAQDQRDAPAPATLEPFPTALFQYRGPLF